ncbi:MAG: endonuclease III [bacterium]|nr:endonuclease III [bacterium]
MRTIEETAVMLRTLQEVYGEVLPFLNHETSFQLLVAVILSAQTTDILVNKVTPALFEKYPDAASLKNASVEDVSLLVGRINYFRTKARNLVAMAKLIDEQFGGEVPQTIEELILLPGVGRKVANVIVADVYKKALGVVVDTHIKRVSYRVGWTDHEDPKRVELDLMQQWPIDHWVGTPKQVILIGRQYCFANKRPDCEHCPLREWCWKRLSGE